jgi:hypothetical protein
MNALERRKGMNILSKTNKQTKKEKRVGYSVPPCQFFLPIEAWKSHQATIFFFFFFFKKKKGPLALVTQLSHGFSMAMCSVYHGSLEISPNYNFLFFLLIFFQIKSPTTYTIFPREFSTQKITCIITNLRLGMCWSTE